MVGCIDFPIRLQSFGFYYETVVPIRNSVLVGAIDLTALTVQPCRIFHVDDLAHSFFFPSKLTSLPCCVAS